MKMRTKLTASVTVISLISMLLVTLAGVDVSRRVLLRETLDKARYMANLESGIISGWIDSQKTLVHSIGATAIWMNDTDRLGEYLAVQKEENPYLMSVYAGFSNGTVLSVSADDSPGLDPLQRPWYQAAVASDGDVAVTEPYLDAGTGKPCVSVSWLAGSIHGLDVVIAIDISVEQLVEIISGVSIKDGYAFLSTSDGTIIAHSDLTYDIASDIADNMRSDTTYSQVFDALKDDEDYIRVVDSGGEPRYFVCAEVEAASWILYVAMPANEIYATAYAMAPALSALAAAVMTVTWLVMNIIIKILVVKPLDSITAFAGAVEKGGEGEAESFEGTVELLERTDEIGTMARALHAMIRRLGKFTEQLELKVRERTSELERMTAEATSLGNAKTQFLAAMSHEIRTPMNAIIGMSDLLLLESLDNRQRGYVKDINISAVSLLGIINDILDFSKIDAGKFSLSPDHYDFPMMFTNVASLMEMIAANKGLDFIVEISDDVPRFVYGDDMKLRQVLVNILSNAVKFTEEGHIRLSADAGEELLKISIEDTGIGIRKEDVKKLFDPFEQFDKQRNRDKQGTGLGLAITQGIITMMGGSIEVDSVYGSGTTFRLTIPYVLGDESRTRDDMDDFSFISAPDAKVLLTDDIESNRNVGRGLLRLCDIECDTANNGLEALQMVQEKEYDLVFMDHMMPEMDGLEAVKAIRALGGRFGKGGLVIIALTANATRDAKELLLEGGMDDFLTKPVDKARLNQALKRWLPKEKVKENAKILKEEGDYTWKLAKADEIDGLDVELGLARMSGMEDYEQSLRLLSRQIPDFLAELERFLKSSDNKGFSILIHGMKGALATNGCAALSDMARDMEDAANDGNMTLCENRMPEFSALLSELGVELAHIFSEAESVAKAEGNRDDLMEALENIALAVERFDGLRAIDEMSCLEGFTYGKEIDATLLKIGEALENFDYDNASELIDSIKC